MARTPSVQPAPHLCNTLLLGGTDKHMLAKQMGTSVRMLELHYSKLIATMAADKLAGKQVKSF